MFPLQTGNLLILFDFSLFFSSPLSFPFSSFRFVFLSFLLSFFSFPFRVLFPLLRLRVPSRAQHVLSRVLSRCLLRANVLSLRGHVVPSRVRARGPRVLSPSVLFPRAHVHEHVPPFRAHVLFRAHAPCLYVFHRIQILTRAKFRYNKIYYTIRWTIKGLFFQPNSDLRM